MNKLPPEKLEKLRERIQFCRDHDNVLNDWERDFLESIYDSSYQYNNLTWPQQKTLTKIYEKVVNK